MDSAEHPSETITVDVDGEREVFEFDAGATLMEVLRANGHYSVKNGCSEGTCGSCNVLYGDNQMVRSCLVPAEQYDGEELTTAKGLVADDGSLHPLQEEFLDHGAAQCGFCIPGMILSGVQLLEKNPDPTEAEIRHAFQGNICRCTGYVQQFEAVERAAERMESTTEEPVEGD